MSTRILRVFEAKYRSLTSDIYKFCDALNYEPSWQQRELFDAIMTGYLKIAIRSGQGPGKTRALAVIGLFRLAQRPYSKLVVTAPTMQQCKEAWLGEVTILLRNADPVLQQMFQVTSTTIGVCGQKAKDWGAILRTSATTEGSQGQHREDMDIICDEASGVDRGIIEQYKGTLTNPGGMFIMAGNPNTRDCAFFDCFHLQRHMWKCIHWNAEETPESSWFSHQRNREFVEEYGRDSDAYRIRVLGEFPLQDPNCVMSEEMVMAVMGDPALMQKCVRMGRMGTGEPVRQFGIDFARFGGDESTIFRRSGYHVAEWNRFSHVDPTYIVDKAYHMQLMASWPDTNTWFVPDAGGMGQGIMHRFYQAGKNVVEFHSQGKALKRDFDNRITQAWFHLAKLVRTRNCSLPKDGLLASQLATRRYFTTKKGKLIIESKEDYKKRGYPSPDRADGCVLCFWDSVEATGNVSSQYYSQHAVGSV